MANDPRVVAPAGRAGRRSKKKPVYHVPAVEKALDILECLASNRVPLSQAQLARTLHRAANELFRMLSCLERRGYIMKDQFSGRYGLTLRLFELSRTHSPYKHLVRAAAGPMRKLSDALRESCHLSVIHNGRQFVMAQEESAERVRFSVEVGSSYPLVRSVSGRLLLANLPDDERRQILEQDADYRQLDEAERVALETRFQEIAARGYETDYSKDLVGVIDFAVPVGMPKSVIKAALAISSVVWKANPWPSTNWLKPMQECSHAIQLALGLISSGAENPY